ncbi:unnamed protein product [Strongylus vulgaris]|uniref:Uncharacterized protein n=1 Tax=Strongylus vulgaris TaxID=40348 RepID=A0A3P7JJA4_STRVU|nr:unnamed protein product [Strongylus vulgaris]
MIIISITCFARLEDKDKRHSTKRGERPHGGEIPRRETGVGLDQIHDDEDDFPYWIFLMLLPLIVTLIVAIGCFAFYKRAYVSWCENVHTY